MEIMRRGLVDGDLKLRLRYRTKTLFGDRQRINRRQYIDKDICAGSVAYCCPDHTGFNSRQSDRGSVDYGASGICNDAIERSRCALRRHWTGVKKNKSGEYHQCDQTRTGPPPGSADLVAESVSLAPDSGYVVSHVTHWLTSQVRPLDYLPSRPQPWPHAPASSLEWSTGVTSAPARSTSSMIATAILLSLPATSLQLAAQVP